MRHAGSSCTSKGYQLLCRVYLVETLLCSFADSHITALLLLLWAASHVVHDVGRAASFGRRFGVAVANQPRCRCTREEGRDVEHLTRIGVLLFCCTSLPKRFLFTWKMVTMSQVESLHTSRDCPLLYESIVHALLFRVNRDRAQRD